MTEVFPEFREMPPVYPGGFITPAYILVPPIADTPPEGD
jgi:hypothetical protein